MGVGFLFAGMSFACTKRSGMSLGRRFRAYNAGCERVFSKDPVDGCGLGGAGGAFWEPGDEEGWWVHHPRGRGPEGGSRRYCGRSRVSCLWVRWRSPARTARRPLPAWSAAFSGRPASGGKQLHGGEPGLRRYRCFGLGCGNYGWAAFKSGTFRGRRGERAGGGR